MKITNHYIIVGCLYTNYIIQSIAVVIIMQFSFALCAQLHTNLIGLGYVASGIGVGKMGFMFLAGLFSDRWGRRSGILVGMLCYVVFFLGLMVCTSVPEAFVLTVLAGMGNAFLDTGSMPALTELFPTSAGSASVLIKAFISIGTLILPFIVTLVYTYEIWYGSVLWGIALILCVNAILLSQTVFPEKIRFTDSSLAASFASGSIRSSNLMVEGVCFVLMGFTVTATFVTIVQWLPTIAIHAVGMEQMAAKQLISDYSMGSLIGVIVTAYSVKKWIKPICYMILSPLLSCVMLSLFLFYQTPIMCKLVAVIMGITAAGGILQLTLVVMQQVFPKRKGLSVGIMYTLSGLAFMIIPLIIPSITLMDVRLAILFNFLMAFFSVLFAAIIFIRLRSI